MKTLAKILLIALLTVLTQIGGLLFLLAWIGQRLRPRKRGLLLYFVLIYGAAVRHEDHVHVQL